LVFGGVTLDIVGVLWFLIAKVRARQQVRVRVRAGAIETELNRMKYDTSMSWCNWNRLTIGWLRTRWMRNGDNGNL
jgi:hypothetical protein